MEGSTRRPPSFGATTTRRGEIEARHEEASGDRAPVDRPPSPSRRGEGVELPRDYIAPQVSLNGPARRSVRRRDSSFGQGQA